MKQAWSTAIVLSALCGVAVAQSSGNTAAAIEACAQIQDQAARLDCFDKLAGPARSVETAPSSAKAPAAVEPQRSAAAPPAAADTAADPAASVPSKREARAADRAESEVMSSVTALREIQPGRVEVTLANGQVWRQTSSDRYNLLVGHAVKIYPSGFGKYFRLTSTEVRGFTQVERVK